MDKLVRRQSAKRLIPNPSLARGSRLGYLLKNVQRQVRDLRSSTSNCPFGVRVRTLRGTCLSAKRTRGSRTCRKKRGQPRPTRQWPREQPMKDPGLGAGNGPVSPTRGGAASGGQPDPGILLDLLAPSTHRGGPQQAQLRARLMTNSSTVLDSPKGCQTSSDQLPEDPCPDHGGSDDPHMDAEMSVGIDLDPARPLRSGDPGVARRTSEPRLCRGHLHPKCIRVTLTRVRVATTRNPAHHGGWCGVFGS